MPRKNSVHLNMYWSLLLTERGKISFSLLRSKGIQYYALTNNKYGKKKLEAMGVDSIIMVDTEDAATWVLPDIQISKVYLFEISFNLCSRYIQICKEWGQIRYTL